MHDQRMTKAQLIDEIQVLRNELGKIKKQKSHGKKATKGREKVVKKTSK